MRAARLACVRVSDCAAARSKRRPAGGAPMKTFALLLVASLALAGLVLAPAATATDGCVTHARSLDVCIHTLRCEGTMVGWYVGGQEGSLDCYT